MAAAAAPALAPPGHIPHGIVGVACEAITHLPHRPNTLLHHTPSTSPQLLTGLLRRHHQMLERAPQTTEYTQTTLTSSTTTSHFLYIVRQLKKLVAWL
jgi:hypothetical protein